MEKYFKIEMRLAEGAIEERTENYRLMNKFYWGDGYIRIEDNKISGAIDFDYIEGQIGEVIVELCLYTEEADWEMEIRKEDFYLPQNFLMLYENVAIQLFVGEEVRSVQKQEAIRKGIETARNYQMQ